MTEKGQRNNEGQQRDYLTYTPIEHVSVLKGFICVTMHSGETAHIKGSAVSFVIDVEGSQLGEESSAIIGCANGSCHTVRQRCGVILAAIDESYKQAARR